MSIYKNISFSAKTFYGVKFEPGEVKEVPGYINCPGMVRVYSMPNIKATEPALESTAEDIPEAPVQPTTRGRKKKSSEPEKVSVAENTDTKFVEITQEETSNGNQC